MRSSRVVEHPRVLASRALAPAREPRMNALRVRRIDELDQPREPPGRKIQRQRSAQRLIEIRLLARRKRVRPSDQQLEAKPFKNSTLRAVGGSCSGLKPVGSPFLSARYVPPSARTRISSPRSLSKTTWVTPCRASIASRKPTNTVLPGPRRSADEGMPGVLAAPAVGILGVARVQREVIRRARGRDQERQCLAPVIAGRATGRIVVKGHHRREIARGDRAPCAAEARSFRGAAPRRPPRAPDPPARPSCRYRPGARGRAPHDRSGPLIAARRSSPPPSGVSASTWSVK